jgi:hypothetical protein
MARNPSQESNAEKFVNLANKRVPKALRCLDLVGNLANTSNYSYTDEQIAKISKVLKDKVNDVCNKFKASRVSPEQQFRID